MVFKSNIINILFLHNVHIHVLPRSLENIQYNREQSLIEAQKIKCLSKPSFSFIIPFIIEWKSFSSSTLFGIGITEIFMFSRSGLSKITKLSDLKQILFMIFFLFAGLAVAVRASTGTSKLNYLSSPIRANHSLKGFPCAESYPRKTMHVVYK